jgi:fluoride exporter
VTSAPHSMNPFDDEPIEIDEGRGRREAGQRSRQRRAQGVIVFALGCGGVVGAVARYAVSLGLPTPPNQFPWSTFLINVSGSALLGFLLILLIEQFPRGRLVRPLVGSGVIGAYTTFSTFEVDTVLLFRAHDIGVGLLYLFSSLFAGLLAIWLGMNAARILIKAEQWLQGEL